MNKPADDAVHDFVVECVRDIARQKGRDLGDLPETFDLMDSGVFDSLEFVGLITSVEERFDVEIDFGEMDPEEFVKLDRFVAAVTRAVH